LKAFLILNKEKYRKFCKTENNIPIFSKDWWLDSVCGYNNWDVIVIEKGGIIIATFPYVLTRRWGVITIHQPILTQTMGIYFNYAANQKYYKKLSFEKNVVENIIDKLPVFDKLTHSFNFYYSNMLPFYWHGYDLNVNYTYVIENITVNELEKNLEPDIRRRRKKTIDSGVKVFESDDIKTFYKLSEMTFKRQRKNIPYSFKFLENLYNNCKKKNACRIIVAKDKENNLIAGSFLIYDETTVYYLMGGMDPNRKLLGGMNVVLLDSIKFALKNNRKFDFEGSMIESIEKYFRSFGAVQKPYYTISRVNSKILKTKRFIKDILK
jgi:hypothetical protein